MRKKAFILLALAIPLAIGTAVYRSLHIPQPEGVCRLETVSSVPYLVNYDVAHLFQALEEKPPALSGVPETINGSAAFYSIPFRHRQLVCCLFEVGENAYSMIADLNGDNRLSDEKPLWPRVEQTADDELFLFGPLSLTGSAAAAPFYLFLTDSSGVLCAAPATVRTGQIRIADSVYSILLADLDFDNRYITRFSPECLVPDTPWLVPLCDRLLIDLDADGRFANSYFTRMESMPLCSLIRLGDRFYQIDVVADALTAAPHTPQTGPLKLNTESSSLMLYSGTYCDFWETSRAAELPAGHYSVIYAQNSFKNPKDDLWTCRSRSRSRSAGTFTISRGFGTRFCFPTSFGLRTDIRYEQGTCRIAMEIIDDSGTAYAPLLQKNYQRTEKPQITICDSTNKVIHSGTMEYG